MDQCRCKKKGSNKGIWDGGGGGGGGGIYREGGEERKKMELVWRELGTVTRSSKVSRTPIKVRRVSEMFQTVRADQRYVQFR